MRAMHAGTSRPRASHISARWAADITRLCNGTPFMIVEVSGRLLVTMQVEKVVKMSKRKNYRKVR